MEVLKRNKKASKISPGKKKWLKAVKLVKDRGDPWHKFNLGKIKSEKGRRHRWTLQSLSAINRRSFGRYNPVTQKWVVDECVLKLDKEPFAHGAMRECYRM